MYHAGQTRTQLIFPIKIITVVIAIARIIAQCSLIRVICRPWKTPTIPGARKSSKQMLGRDDSRNLARQNKHGEQTAAMLTHRVRRESEPTTNPPVQDHATRRKSRPTSGQNPAPKPMKC
jgi:hypothetical protein